MIAHSLSAGFERHEEIVGKAIIRVVRELRLIDAAALVDLIRDDRMAELGDLFASAAELHFRPRTLDFAMLAEAEVGWLAPPCITLRLEFVHAGVTVLFALTMQADIAAVTIDAVLGEAGVPSIAELSAAIDGAQRGRPASGKLDRRI